MKDILLIAPYKEMYQSARLIAEDSKYQSIDVVRGNLSEGLVLAINAIESHIRVIISRGGTYRLIKQSNIGIPVVEIRSSPSGRRTWGRVSNSRITMAASSLLV